MRGDSERVGLAQSPVPVGGAGWLSGLRERSLMVLPT
jgi:hypothetical protein